MRHFIITGGIGAGKTQLISRICETGNYVIGSPATTMKRKLAQMIARTINSDSSTTSWLDYFNEMMDRHAKEKYRGILQGYGEHFSNLDNFFWIRRTMSEVQQEIDSKRWDNDFDFIDGTVYDSIRRPQEIIGIKEVYPDAIRVHLSISVHRQTEFLLSLGKKNLTEVYATLNHSSEHWLDEISNPDCLANIEINADKGDEYVWDTFSKVVGIGID